ncbi:MAG: hypothetical protein ABJP34_10595 [Erythrobacter sp.]
MGITLLAILSGALLLPGIIAALTFFRISTTADQDVASTMPSLGTPMGIAVAGFFTLIVNVTFIVCLILQRKLPDVVPMHESNPYILLFDIPNTMGGLHVMLSFGSGLIFLCILSVVVGHWTGKGFIRFEKNKLFYGPLSATFEKAKGDNKFIIAHVLSKVGNEFGQIGYEGILDQVTSDKNKCPTMLVLKDVTVFRLKQLKTVVKREDIDQRIGLLAIRSEDWHNIAFEIFEFSEASSQN